MGENVAAQTGILHALCKAGGAFLDILAPELCVYCQQPTHEQFAICEHCFGELTPNDKGCPNCALPDCAGQLCPQCLSDDNTLPKICAPYVYDAAMAFFIAQWKYRGIRRLSATAAKMMLSEPISLKDSEIILSVPLHWRRHLDRGFNQCDDLGSSLRRYSSRFSREDRHVPRLRRTRATTAQASAARRERMQNLADAFAVDGDLNGRSVTVIDDVCTTGATAIAIAHSLTAAGAGDVRIWCIARTPIH